MAAGSALSATCSYHHRMCSNYRPVSHSDHLLSYFGVSREQHEVPVDVWPLGIAPFIRLAEDGSGNKVIDDGVFGLLPAFATEMAAGRRTYNARSETVAVKPSFREAWSKGWRCIIPVDSFYEPCWETGKAVRWRVQQPGSHPMGLAGIYRKWTGPDGHAQFTFSMLTVNADGHPVMTRFHRPEDEKRMVVILAEADYAQWLSCQVEEAPSFLLQWRGPLEAAPSPLQPKAVKSRRAPLVSDGQPVSGQLF